MEDNIYDRIHAVEMKKRHTNFGFLGIKLSCGHLDLWTVGKAHRTARISKGPRRGGGGGKSLDNDANERFVLRVPSVTKHTETLTHVIYRVCDVKCVSATYAVHELAEESSSCFK